MNNSIECLQVPPTLSDAMLDDKDDDRELVYVGRGSGRREREEGSYVDGQRASSSSSRRYNDNVEFFDLDDDDDASYDDDDEDDD